MQVLKIGLLFHSAKNDNLGVGALTVSEVEILRRISRDRGIPIHVTVLDGDDPRLPYVSGPDVQVLAMRPMRHPGAFFRILRGLDLVIDIGGGDSFADIYGGKRLAQMMAQKVMVHAAGKSLVLAPQTMGPFASPVWARIAAWSISRSAIVATRDSLSTTALRGMGFEGKIIEASDVALRLPYDPPPQRSPGGPVRVGLNVSGLLMQGGYTRDNMFRLRMDYPRLMRDLITAFLQHADGCEVHLVPHVIAWGGGGGVEDDMQASRILASEFQDVRVAPAFATPSEAKSYIAGMDFFAGARMHACVAAFSSGVAVVPMAYSRKFAGLFGSLGYNHTVDCTSETTEVMLTRIMTAYENRVAMAAEARECLGKGLAKLALYEEALTALLDDRFAASKL